MYDNGENDLIKGGLQPYYEPLLQTILKLGATTSTVVHRQNYIIVIDEINRANISRVFGELITLIEEDKRSEGDTPLKCTLPSGDVFQVPSNLFILGTMNSADKSLALLDIALRRRFEFVAIYPDPALVNGLEKQEVLTKLNKKIFDDKGPDFQIGHAYFMKDDTIEDCMNRKVVPLLSEYYMNTTDEVRGLLRDIGFETTDKYTYPIKVTNYNG
jgi:5-methylcytosine-specific restriction protein B